MKERSKVLFASICVATVFAFVLVPYFLQDIQNKNNLFPLPMIGMTFAVIFGWIAFLRKSSALALTFTEIYLFSAAYADVLLVHIFLDWRTTLGTILFVIVTLVVNLNVFLAFLGYYKQHRIRYPVIIEENQETPETVLENEQKLEVEEISQ